MGSMWQRWLSPRPLRTDISSDKNLVGPDDLILYEFGRDDSGRAFVKETHYIDKPAVKAGLSGPGLHVHLFQTEFFEVEQGVLGVHKNGKDYTLAPGEGVFQIAPGDRHRFWAHSTCTQDLIFKVWVQPQPEDGGFDENWLRNLITYIKDCQKANISPSPFQIMLFAEAANIVFLPPASSWVPLWALSLVQRVFAHGVGSFLLGYKDKYPEYSIQTGSSDSTSRKTK